MAMRSSKKLQFTVTAPPSPKYKFTMHGLGICMTRAILLRKINPRRRLGAVDQVNGDCGETPGRLVRLKVKSVRLPGVTEERK